MSFLFNKLRSFTEWHNMDDALETATTSSAKKQKSFTEAQGKSFSEFARKQPEQVQEVLFRLDGALKQAMESLKGGDDVLPKVRSELMKLRPLNDDIKAKRKHAKSLEDRAAKSAKAAEAAERKLENLRARNPSSPEFNRAQDEYDLAVRQKQSDITAREERQALLVGEEREYKKQMWLCILNTLEQYASAKQTSAASTVSIGDQIGELGTTVPFYEDPGIEILQTQLQTLRTEPIE